MPSYIRVRVLEHLSPPPSTVKIGRERIYRRFQWSPDSSHPTGDRLDRSGMTTMSPRSYWRWKQRSSSCSQHQCMTLHKTSRRVSPYRVGINAQYLDPYLLNLKLEEVQYEVLQRVKFSTLHYYAGNSRWQDCLELWCLRAWLPGWAPFQQTCATE